MDNLVVTGIFVGILEILFILIYLLLFLKNKK